MMANQLEPCSNCGTLIPPTNAIVEGDTTVCRGCYNTDVTVGSVIGTATVFLVSALILLIIVFLY